MSVSRINAESVHPHAANAISSSGPTSAAESAAKYSRNAVDDSDCSFVLRSASNKGALRIEVRTMSEPGREFPFYAARCSAHAKALKAIGNEAILCSIETKSGGLTEQAVGRVRDRAFVIHLSLNDSSVTEDLLREKTRKVADLVAGNLF